MQSSKNTIWKQITTILIFAFYRINLYAIFKEHNLKANHNSPSKHAASFRSVCNLQRTQSESKSQPHLDGCLDPKFCMQSSKNTIWKQITTTTPTSIAKGILYAIFKEHNLKANHNLDACCGSRMFFCMQSSKNTIWKQITTTSTSDDVVTVLYAIFKEHNLKANHNRHRRV